MTDCCEWCENPKEKKNCGDDGDDKCGSCECIECYTAKGLSCRKCTDGEETSEDVCQFMDCKVRTKMRYDTAYLYYEKKYYDDDYEFLNYYRKDAWEISERYSARLCSAHKNAISNYDEKCSYCYKDCNMLKYVTICETQQCYMPHLSNLHRISPPSQIICCTCTEEYYTKECRRCSINTSEKQRILRTYYKEIDKHKTDLLLKLKLVSMIGDNCAGLICSFIEDVETTRYELFEIIFLKRMPKGGRTEKETKECIIKYIKDFSYMETPKILAQILSELDG